MHPVPREGLSGDGLALGDLALVVREDQVGAAAVQIESGAERIRRHHGALEMPARPADAEGRAPRRLPRLRRLPQDEVERRAPVRVVRVPAASPREADHVLLGIVRQLPVAREGRHVEVGGAVREVGVAGVEEPAHHADHPVDGLGSAGLGRRRAHAQRVHVGLEAGELGVGELQVVDAQLAGLGEDRVVDVGDIAHHANLVTELLQPPGEEVVGDVRGRVAQVCRVVRRDAAHVHAHDGPGLKRDERPLRGVVDAQRHGAAGGRGSTPTRRRLALPL